MRNDPLNPDAIVLLLKLKILKASTIEMSNIFLFEELFGFFNVFRALINDIDLFLNIKLTVL